MTEDNSAIKDKKSSNTKPTIPVTESEEYKALFSQKQILQERISELEEIVKESMKTNPTIGFQNASDINRNPTTTDSIETTTKTPGPGMQALMSATGIKSLAFTEAEFPATLLGKFFIASRNVKTAMMLKLSDNGKVEGWEVN